ncbi:LOW QUALITY PROTEIN: hypothetical protein ACHAXT_007414 [Thalassiosira profunda]
MHRFNSCLRGDDSETDSRGHPPSAAASSSAGVLRGVGCLILGAAALFLLSPAPNTHPGGVGGGVVRPAPEASVHHVADPRARTRKLPVRLQTLLAQNCGHLGEVKEGKKTVEEVIHSGAHLAGMEHESGVGGVHAGGIGSSGHIGAGAAQRNHKSAPMTLPEVLGFFESFLKRLNSSNIKNKRATFHAIWAAYHDLAVKYLYPWDREYLTRMPPRREDGSMFLSVVSYRDEFCPDTLKEAYGKAKNPDKLFVGLVQQNCQENCRSGVLEGGKVEDVQPDPDCYQLFCSSEAGKMHCDAGQVRLLRMKESESLGPYMARYFASKLWMGEEWYMQIDSHMTFLKDWDALSIEMLNKAPSKKPVISHYPPPHTANLVEKAKDPAPRLCGPVFATSDLESQIVRLEGSYNYDSSKLDTPRFAPFVAAGYLVAHSDILREVPFDPFLPYIFMGEEILLSARLWTSAYDIFSPTQSLLDHHYVRNHKPKFWESVHRAFTYGVHNPLQMMVLNRVKYQLGYPEAARDMIKPHSLLTAVEQYSMGTSRSLEEYMKIVGLDMNTKEVTYTAWCETGLPPPGFESLGHLYQ